MGVVRFLPARLPHPLQEGIAPELVFLLLQGLGELEPRGFRRRKLVHGAPLHIRQMIPYSQALINFGSAVLTVP